LRPRRQQYADLLRARSDEISAFHSQPEAIAGLGFARQSHAMGLLDQQSGIGSSGHLSDGRARPAAQLAAYEWVWLPHLYVGERQGPAVLGQVSLPHPARDE